MNVISIIVPIYNTAKYLDECIQSILHQTYSNLEIILVDDGSTDNSLQICKKYAKQDPRIRIFHKENGGLSSARNAGLELATGDYLMFCDADDFYLSNSCELLEKEITEKNADYVIGNYIHCSEEGKLWEYPIFRKEKYSNFQLDIHDYEKSFYIMSSSVCNKIFRLSYIRKLNLHFVDKIPAEDAIFTTSCFIKSKAVFYIDDIIYIYRQRKNGTSISTNNNLNYFRGISKAYYHIYMNFKLNHELGFYRYFYLKTLFYILYKFIDSTVMTKEEQELALITLQWFSRLSEKLNIKPADNDFFHMVHLINKGFYKEAIEISNKISRFRSSMTEEEKQKMVKIPPEEYKNFLKEETVNA